MEGSPKRFQATRRALAREGFRPTGARGQNFVVDGNLLDAIVRDAALEPDETAVEIGTGPGGLTARLARAARRVVAFEIDPRLAAHAEKALDAGPRVEWVVGDALGGSSKRGLHARLREVLTQEACVVVANLPYNIAAPLLANLLEHAPPPRRVVCMVQKEVAERLAAREGTAAYGPLTISVQANARVERLRDVPREVFRPRPRVESSIVRLVPRADRPQPAEMERLHALIGLAFRARRKKLAPQLASWLGGVDAAEARLAELGYPPTVRGEALTVEALRALARSTPKT